MKTTTLFMISILMMACSSTTSIIRDKHPTTKNDDYFLEITLYKNHHLDKEMNAIKKQQTEIHELSNKSEKNFKEEESVQMAYTDLDCDTEDCEEYNPTLPGDCPSFNSNKSTYNFIFNGIIVDKQTILEIEFYDAMGNKVAESINEPYGIEGINDYHVYDINIVKEIEELPVHMLIKRHHKNNDVSIEYTHTFPSLTVQ